MSVAKKIGLLSTGTILSIWYAYWRKSRPLSPEALIPDENRKEVIPPQELSAWFYGSWEEYFAQTYMKDVYSYLISQTFKIPKIKQEFENNSFRILDCGCGTGCLSFEFINKYNKNINEIYGIDLAPQSIKIANNKLINSKIKNITNKLKFICKDSTNLSNFQDNYFDLGYCSLVLHDMPYRVPMNILCELSRVCKYVIVLDWNSPFPWNGAGLRNRRIEFMVGPTHFAGFRNFVALGGTAAHIKSLQKYRNPIKILATKTVDSGTMKLFILDTTNASKPSKL